MNDYCKISEKGSLTAKSRSIDFSDLSFSPPHTPKYPAPNKSAYKPHHDPYIAEEEGGPGERFGVILSRNCSSASQRFRARERGHGAPAATLQAAVRRAFSMRKSSSSSSVSEGYRRIHDTAVEDGDGDCFVDADVIQRRQQQQQQPEARPPRKKRGKIMRACKRIFGF